MTTQPMQGRRLLSARLLDVLAIAALPVAVIVCFVIANVTTDNGPHALTPYQGQYSSVTPVAHTPQSPSAFAGH